MIWGFWAEFLCVTTTHDAFHSHLLCQQLSDFPCLEPEPQQLHFKSDTAFLPIHTGRSSGSCPAALQHVSHGENSGLFLWTEIQKTQIYL